MSGTLEPRKAPGKKPKLDEKATKLLAKDLEARPWATQCQRAEFLLAVAGVRVSEATVCRTVGRLRRSRKKDPKGQQNETNPWKAMAHGGLPHRPWAIGVRR
jgi:transposase